MKYTSALLVIALGILSGCRQQDARPTITVEARNASFGKYPVWESRIGTYRLTNTGRKTVRIGKLSTDCGCAEVSTSKTSLKRGESTDIQATVLPRSIFGAYKKHVIVQILAPTPRELRLPFSGHAVPLVRIKPTDYLMTDRIPLNTAWSQTFDLLPTQPDVMLGTPTVKHKGTVGVTLKKQSSGYQLIAELAPRTTPDSLSCTINVPILTPTNHPPIKLSIAARIGPEFIAVPSILRLPNSAEPQQRTVQLILLGAQPPFPEPSTIALTATPGVTATITASDRPGMYEAQLVFSSDAVNRAQQGTMELSLVMNGVTPASIRCNPPLSAKRSGHAQNRQKHRQGDQ